MINGTRVVSQRLWRISQCILPTKRVHFVETVFDVCENVYEPAEDSFLFAENLDVPNGGQVWMWALAAAYLSPRSRKKAGNVLAVDINPYAMRCAKHNAMLNSVRE